MRLVVVIPCHRRWDLIFQSIEAVSPFPVVVVDDSPASVCPPAVPGASVVRTAGSQGFARAVNVGIRAAVQQGATHVLLLNDDAVPDPGCIDALCAAWGPDVGAVGPVLQDRAGRIESAGATLSWWGRVRSGTVVPRGLQDVDALSGACILISAAERLDESFTHGFEDFALCRDLRHRGFRVRLVGTARCVHVGGGTLNRRSPQAQRHAVSGHLRLLRHRRYLPVVVGLSLAQILREGGPALRIRGVAEGVADWLSDPK